ncbi:hypothetical protein [Aurantimonas sp. VKM B-3413]|uniref:hypothetical protein n=1 Tax=Aurantimonas sp. VKM B-3413 TaxID=2779401 RepID=UPI001E3C04AC|nr:hypothetical protein [Aurantimonas sp. VKM B-3413]MCB8838017.1 hypothetical protein [Aurantimonas sp. VKM B-3413]
MADPREPRPTGGPNRNETTPATDTTRTTTGARTPAGTPAARRGTIGSWVWIALAAIIVLLLVWWFGGSYYGGVNASDPTATDDIGAAPTVTDTTPSTGGTTAPAQ